MMNDAMIEENRVFCKVIVSDAKISDVGRLSPGKSLSLYYPLGFRRGYCHESLPLTRTGSKMSRMCHHVLERI
jgi:hypothetical protein